MTRRMRALKVLINRANFPPIHATPPSVEEITAMQQYAEDAFMYGLHPCGTPQRGRTSTGVFGETVTETYCPACEEPDDGV